MMREHSNRHFILRALLLRATLRREPTEAEIERLTDQIFTEMQQGRQTPVWEDTP